MKNIHIIILIILNPVLGLCQVNGNSINIQAENLALTLIEKKMVTISYSKENLTKINQYDENLNLEFNQEINSLNNFPFRKYLENNTIHFLFYDRKNGLGQIISFDTKSGSIAQSDTLKLGKYLFVDFIVNQEIAYLYYSKSSFHYQANLITYNLKSGEKLIIPLESKTRTQDPIRSLTYNESMNEVIMPFLHTLKDENFEIMRFDSLGKKKRSFFLSEPHCNSFPYTKMTQLKNKDLVIQGTIASTPQKGVRTVSFDWSGPQYNTAFFLSKYSKDSLEWYKYFDPMEFESFYELNAELKEMKESYFKKQANGKTKKFLTDINFHDPFIYGSGIILIGEILKPTFKKVDKDLRQDNARYVTVFDGYEYSHFVVFKFDLNTGERIWDTAIPLYLNYKPKNMIEHAHVANDSANFTIEFLDKNGLNSIILSLETGDWKARDSLNKETISNKTNVNNNTLENKTKKTYSRTDYWYSENAIKTNSYRTKPNSKNRNYTFSKITY